MVAIASTQASLEAVVPDKLYVQSTWFDPGRCAGSPGARMTSVVETDVPADAIC